MPSEPRLNPRWFERSPSRPAWTRSVLVRRSIAAALVILAAVSAFRGDPDRDRVTVVSAGHDLRPGMVLTESDLTSTRIERTSVPDGATTSSADATGRTVAGPIRSGEILTDVRLLGPRLAGSALSTPDARVVPIRLADPSLANIVQAGDVVDVLTVDDEDGTRVLADGAVVVLVPDADAGTRAQERLILLGLASDAATSVAAASLVSALTVVLH
ncbi:SAF domain-containing protein [Actinomycetes bacterium M1A6_2h]